MNFTILLLSIAAPPDAVGSQPALPVVSSEEAWKRLPPALEGKGVPLPTWARMFAPVSPRMTAALLEFDRTHRTRSPVEPKLRAAMRWTCAAANRCMYTMTEAEFDFRRAGGGTVEFESLRRDFESWSAHERAALRFARRMTVLAADVTDEEFAAVLQGFGEAKTVAMVQLIAAANFQDRLFLTMGVPPEPTGAIGPISTVFDPNVSEEKMPQGEARRKPGAEDPEAVKYEPPKEWTARGFDGARAHQETQKSRVGRIAVPTSDVARDRMKEFRRRPERASAVPSTRPIKVLWTLVCFGYSPELATAWSDLGREYSAEARADRVLLGSMFFVATNTVDCFY